MTDHPHHTPRTNGEGILNVVLHGMVGIVVEKDHVRVLMPQTDDHVFLAGAWRSERRLKQGIDYRLSGVAAGNAGADIARRAIAVRGFPVVDTSELLFCSIRLPIPGEVRNVRIVQRGKLIFTGKTAGQLAGLKEFALIPILRYRYADLKALNLGPLRWHPEPKEGIVNLHIFGEPLTEEIFGHQHNGQSHLQEAFVNMVKLFKGMDLTITGHGDPDDGEPIQGIGLPDTEQVMLVERTADCQSGRLDASNCPPFVVDNSGN